MPVPIEQVPIRQVASRHGSAIVNVLVCWRDRTDSLSDPLSDHPQAEFCSKHGNRRVIPALLRFDPTTRQTPSIRNGQAPHPARRRGPPPRTSLDRGIAAIDDERIAQAVLASRRMRHDSVRSPDRHRPRCRVAARTGPIIVTSPGTNRGPRPRPDLVVSSSERP